jgi:outer membrane protein OmpA-like peptidoglycan-associated protein
MSSQSWHASAIVWLQPDGMAVTKARIPGARFLIRTISALCAGILVIVIGSIARADGDANPGEINRRLYQQLDGSSSAGKIETVSGQMYIPKEHIDRAVINDALAAMLAEGKGSEASVAVRRPTRVNFEIHFKKNSAELSDESRRGLDELGEVLASNYLETRFILGGHTDLDGTEAINQPLSQARAESARAYLVEEHDIASDRIVAEGFGTSEPLYEIEKSPEHKLYNRRVDLRPVRNAPHEIAG